MEYKIGLIGCGTVAQGLLEILESKADSLKERYGFEAKVVAISDKLKGSVLAAEGIQIKKLLDLLRQGKRVDDYPQTRSKNNDTLDPLEMIERSNADIIAELTYTDIKT